MIILLTGQPGVGKTTVLEKFLQMYTEDCFWIVSKELRSEDGARVGFRAVTSDGQQGLIAHKNSIDSEYRIGEYHVDIDAVDHIFCEALIKEISVPEKLLVLDEIGRMQILSSRFVDAIGQLFESTKWALATIRYGDEWTNVYKNHKHAVVFEITIENREEVPNILETICSNKGNMDSLSPQQNQYTLDMLREYAHENRFIQMRKLFKNALRYIHEKRAEQKSITSWTVHGDHREHHVYMSPSEPVFTCDCDLYLGEGEFRHHAGECSHIQAIKILHGI